MRVPAPSVKEARAVGYTFEVQQLTAGGLLLVAISAVAALGDATALVRSSIQFASFAIAALGTGWLIASERAPRISAALVVCAVIPLWGALQLILGTSAYGFGTRNAILDTAVFCALFFAAVQTFGNTQLRRRLLQILFAFGSLVSVAVILACGAHPVDGGHYCVFIELLLPIGLWLATERPGFHRMSFVWAVLCATLVSSAIISGSRAGIALIAAEILAVAFIRPHSRMPLAFLLVLVSVFAAAVGWEQLSSRFGQDHSLQARAPLVAAAVDMARDRPLTGYGLGSFEIVYPAYALINGGARANHAYNDWAEWAATGGLPVLALYITMFGLMLPVLTRKWWAIGVVAMCLHGLVDFPFEIPALLVLNAILMGAASGAD